MAGTSPAMTDRIELRVPEQSQLERTKPTRPNEANVAEQSQRRNVSDLDAGPDDGVRVQFWQNDLTGITATISSEELGGRVAGLAPLDAAGRADVAGTAGEALETHGGGAFRAD
jgi:hypothetical protein